MPGNYVVIQVEKDIFYNFWCSFRQHMTQEQEEEIRYHHHHHRHHHHHDHHHHHNHLEMHYWSSWHQPTAGHHLNDMRRGRQLAPSRLLASWSATCDRYYTYLLWLFNHEHYWNDTTFPLAPKLCYEHVVKLQTSLWKPYVGAMDRSNFGVSATQNCKQSCFICRR